MLDGSFKDYKATKDGLSHITDLEVEEVVSKPPRRGLHLRMITEALKEVSGVTDDDSTPKLRRPAAQPAPSTQPQVSDDDDCLSELLHLIPTDLRSKFPTTIILLFPFIV